MSKITYGELVRATKGIALLAQQKFPPVTAMKIARLGKWAEGHLETYNTVLEQVVDLYAEKDSDGNNVPATKLVTIDGNEEEREIPGAVKLADVAGYQADMKNLDGMSVKVPAEDILKVSDVEKAKDGHVPPGALLDLGPLLADDKSVELPEDDAVSSVMEALASLRE